MTIAYNLYLRYCIASIFSDEHSNVLFVYITQLRYNDYSVLLFDFGTSRHQLLYVYVSVAKGIRIVDLER